MIFKLSDSLRHRMLPAFLVCIGCSADAGAQLSNCSMLTDPVTYETAYPRLFADNRKVLYQSNESGHWQLVVMDIASKKQVNISNDGFNNNFPDLSPDNKYIAFVSDRDGNEEIYLMAVSGDSIRRLTRNAARDIHPYFSPDGKLLLYNSTAGNGSLDIYQYDIAAGTTTRLTDTPDNETCARYAPDMKQIVYLRNNDAEDDVYVMDVNTRTIKNLTNTPFALDGWPVYDRNGKWIYFSSMEAGPHSIYRIDLSGLNKKRLTTAIGLEEDARVYISNDNHYLVYNKRIGRAIRIYMCELMG